MNSTEPPDVEGTKRKSIVEMALKFTDMIRIFVKGSKDRIATKLDKFFLSLAEICNREDYEVLHRCFCEWFTQHIQTAEKKPGKKYPKIQPSAPTSYGQAAKVLDVALKVYVYYCAQPTQEVAKQIVPLLNGAIDTVILNHLKKSECTRGKIRATTLKALDKQAYLALQSLLRVESLACELHPVQYEDILFRRLIEERARRRNQSRRPTP